MYLINDVHLFLSMVTTALEKSWEQSTVSDQSRSQSALGAHLQPPSYRCAFKFSLIKILHVFQNE